MEILNIGIEQAKQIVDFGSQGVRLRHVGRGTGRVTVTLAWLEPGGRLARHPAVGPQLLVALSGSGEVSGAAGEFVPLGVGQGALWEPGEEHETRSAAGLTALMLEGEFEIHPGWRGE
jgi:quercetin dioxygenase-like cupin family protein